MSPCLPMLGADQGRPLFPLQVIDAKLVVDRQQRGPKGSGLRIAECLVGDATGVIILSARNEQGERAPDVALLELSACHKLSAMPDCLQRTWRPRGLTLSCAALRWTCIAARCAWWWGLLERWRPPASLGSSPM